MAPTSTLPEPSDHPVRLCDRCEVLRSIDGACGHVHVKDDGTPMVEHYSLTNDLYDFTDSLPDLPDLARSAESGCDFCHFLRLSILNAIRRMDLSRLDVMLSITVTCNWQYSMAKGRLCLPAVYALIYRPDSTPDPIAYSHFMICSDDSAYTTGLARSWLTSR